MGRSRLDSRLWDTYSLGVVFYELLTGEIAFPARKGKQEIVRIISQKQKIPWLDPVLVPEEPVPDPQPRPPSQRIAPQTCRR